MTSSVKILHGDCLELLPTLADASVDACVTDPPYHLTGIFKRLGGDNAAVYGRSAAGFMGKQWDGGDIAFRTDVWREVFRVLKPGGHLLAFGGSRTYHRLACAIEDAGFEIRDQIMWLYGSGFPKSHDVSKGIDNHHFDQWLKSHPNERAQYDEQMQQAGDSSAREHVKRKFQKAAGVSRKPTGAGKSGSIRSCMSGNFAGGEYMSSAPGTADTARWEGWGTALKPAHEPIVMARKPLSEKTVAANVLAHGTGGLNVDGCRVESSQSDQEAIARTSNSFSGSLHRRNRTEFDSSKGRWPANVIHDGSAEVVEGFPPMPALDGDFGSAARFFYSAKADKAERISSKHPTVKPIDLMAYLCRLVTPPGGLVLDPFAGSGTTGMACMREGFDAILIEREAKYVADIRRRISHVSGDDAPLFAGREAG